MMRTTLAAALVAAAFSAGPVAAQAPQTVPEADPCLDGRVTADGRPCPTLSDKLDETGGVVRPPPGVDPGIHRPAPDPMPGTTPVIPPGAIAPQPADPSAEGPPVPE